MLITRPEKRNYRRVDASVDVELVIEGKRMNTTTSNMSCGGLFLPIKNHLLKERADIEVILSLPETKKPVRVVGEVSRFQSRSFLGRKPAGVAIRFRGLYDDNIMAIDRFIKNKLH